MRGKSIMLYREEKLQKQAAPTPVFTLECPHWFIRTLFLVAHGTVMDSWELTMIHAKLISEISEARLMLEKFSASTPQLFIIFLPLHKHRRSYLYQKDLLKEQVCLLSFTLQTVRTSNGLQLIAWTFPLHGPAHNGIMLLVSCYQNNNCIKPHNRITLLPLPVNIVYGYYLLIDLIQWRVMGFCM